MFRIFFKILFNVANAAVIVLGVGIFVCGYYSGAVGAMEFSEELNQQVTKMSYSIMVFGVGIICVGVIGMVSINFNIRLLSFIYKIMLISAAAILIVCGIVALVVLHVINTSLRSEMIDMMGKTTSRDKMDKIEKTHKCCGVEGHMGLYQKGFAGNFPPSCCRILGILKQCLEIEAFKVRCDQIWMSDRDKLLFFAGIGMLIVGIYCAALAVLVHCAERRD